MKKYKNIKITKGKEWIIREKNSDRISDGRYSHKKSAKYISTLFHFNVERDTEIEEEEIYKICLERDSKYIGVTKHCSIIFDDKEVTEDYLHYLNQAKKSNH